MPTDNPATDSSSAQKGSPIKQPYWQKYESSKALFIGVWIAIGVVSLLWWTLESQHCLRRFVLIGGLSLAAFMVGTLIGFLFSSYGEEASTIGKVRDWVIGGITTLTIAKAASIKNTIATFAADGACCSNCGPAGSNEFAIAFGAAVAYATLGFFFMYFLRELYFNLELAQSRQERGEIEGTRQVDQVVKTFQLKLPASILTGGDDISDITDDARKQAAQQIKDKLYSPDVNAFLQSVDTAVTDGANLDWDIVSKAAMVHYYRTYFETDKVAQARRALEWIERALLLNPHHMDMTMKYTDMLATTGDYAGAVSILERIVNQADAPLMVRQWLGYYLLYVPKRLSDSIRYSEDFRRMVGEDTDSLFNIACAYAQAYCGPAGAEPGLEDAAKNYNQAFAYLRMALQREPSYAAKVSSDWTKTGESFQCFAQDPQFLQIVGPKP